MDFVRVTNFRCSYGDIHEPRLHEHSLEGFSRPQSDRNRADTANHWNVDGQEDSSHQGLNTRKIMLLLIAASTFVCGCFTVMGLYWLAFRSSSIASVRLAELKSQTIRQPENGLTPDPGPVAAITEQIVEPLNRLVPPSAAEAAKLRKQLMQAGFSSHEAVLVYRAIYLSSMVLLPLAVAMLYILLAKPVSSATVPIL